MGGLAIAASSVLELSRVRRCVREADAGRSGARRGLAPAMVAGLSGEAPGIAVRAEF